MSISDLLLLFSFLFSTIIKANRVVKKDSRLGNQNMLKFYVFPEKQLQLKQWFSLYF